MGDNSVTVSSRFRLDGVRPRTACSAAMATDSIAPLLRQIAARMHEDAATMMSNAVANARVRWHFLDVAVVATTRYLDRWLVFVFMHSRPSPQVMKKVRHIERATCLRPPGLYAGAVLGMSSMVLCKATRTHRLITFPMH